MMRPSLLYALLALSLLGTKCAYDHGQRQAGVWQERARVADSTAGALRRSIRSVDSAYRKDTVALSAALARYTAARQALSRRLPPGALSEKVVRISDTITVSDTVRVPVETVRWVVAEADSTIQACRSVVVTCEQRVAQRDSLNAVLSQRLKIEQARRPSGVKRWAERAAWVGLVVLVGR